MRLSPILTIFRKDVFDAVRDARVLVAILVPFGIGVFYNVIMDDEVSQPEATIVWTGDRTSQLPEQIINATSGVVDTTMQQAADEEELRQQIADENADIGLIIPVGFDTSVSSGDRPDLVVVLPESPSFGGDYLAASIQPVVRAMAGQGDPIQMEYQTVTAIESGDVLSQVGIRRYFVLAAATMLIGMIAMLAVPVILADEADKHTLDALVMIVSYPEVIAAKALFGFAYILLSIPLLLSITGIMPENLLLFAAGMTAFSVALVGFGLLLGSLFNATQLNTWGGILLLPVLFPAFATGLPAPRAVEIAGLMLPTSHATRIALNGLSGDAIFNNLGLSFLAMGAWAVTGYGLLLWRLSNRES